jgi:hypothetical protein
LAKNPSTNIEDADFSDTEDHLDDVSTLPDQLREWLKLVVAWNRALRDLDGKALKSLVKHRGFTITSIQEGPADGNWASVREALQPLCHMGQLRKELKSMTKLEEIVKEAAMTSRAINASCLQDMSNTTAWNNVEDAVHCEAQLAAQLAPRSMSLVSPHPYMYLRSSHFLTSTQCIGVSKPCCYLCHRLLSKLEVAHSGTHGKVTPWRVPANISETISAGLLADLQHHLIEFLNKKSKRGLSSDSSGGASDQSSDHEEDQTTESFVEWLQKLNSTDGTSNNPSRS